MTCNQLLAWRHIEKGLECCEEEDFVTLHKGDIVIARFHSTSTTPEQVILEADKYLEQEQRQ